MSFDFVKGRWSDIPERIVTLVRSYKNLLIFGGGIFSIALIFTAAGAYDTDDLGLAHRFLLWLLVSGLIVGQSAGLYGFFTQVAPRQNRLWGALASILVTTILVALELHILKFTPLLPKQPDPILGFILFVSPAVAPIAGLTILARLILTDQAKAQPSDQEEPDGGVEKSEAQGAFGPVLEEWPTTPISMVKASDHYLEVTSEGVQHLVHGRMKDAVAHLADVDGLQVHRSWWVALMVIERVETSGRDKVIVLKDGERIPVARSRLEDLRKAGWV